MLGVPVAKVSQGAQAAAQGGCLGRWGLLALRLLRCAFAQPQPFSVPQETADTEERPPSLLRGTKRDKGDGAHGGWHGEDLAQTWGERPRCSGPVTSSGQGAP